MSRKRSFEWDVWDFDCNGSAYIIAKDLCPNKENVPQFIVDADGIHHECMSEMDVAEGWCKYMVRSDWDNADGPCGSYYVEERNTRPMSRSGKPSPGWFPVWIVRQGDWY